MSKFRLTLRDPEREKFCPGTIENVTKEEESAMSKCRRNLRRKRKCE
jgi:hypothetical protein